MIPIATRISNRRTRSLRSGSDPKLEKCKKRSTKPRQKIRETDFEYENGKLDLDAEMPDDRPTKRLRHRQTNKQTTAPKPQKETDSLRDSMSADDQMPVESVKPKVQAHSSRLQHTDSEDSASERPNHRRRTKPEKDEVRSHEPIAHSDLDEESDEWMDDHSHDTDDSPQQKKQRQRKQAAEFRFAEKTASDVVESIEDVAEDEVSRFDSITGEHKRSRLNHSDESTGIVHGAGSLTRKAIAVGAAPVKHQLRRSMAEAAQENDAVASAEAGAETTRYSVKAAHASVRLLNLHDRTAEENVPHKLFHSGEKAAQVEHSKKEQIRAFQRKKRHRAAVIAKRNESVVSAGGFVDSASSVFKAPAKAKKAAVSFVSEHKGAIMGIAVGGVLFLMVAIVISSLASVVQGSGTSIIETTYMSTDESIYAADNAYSVLESTLNAQVNAIERTHPGYDEYNYQIDEIEHNPYALISYLQVKYGAFTYDDTIQAAIRRLFESQYTLSVSEGSQTRTRMETVTETIMTVDPETGDLVPQVVQYEQEVEYEYKMLYVVLTNKDLSIAARGDLTSEELIVFDALNRTYGNRPYLFDIDSLPGVGGAGSSGIHFDIPPEALSDAKFANIIREAEKYLGMPYVWGGKNPRSGFDCSGFVCWVLNHCGNGWNVGTIRAKELCRLCTYVSPEQVRPGDLIFFEKTYETSGASHVGFYVGNGVMLHCGNPIKYSKINTRYYKEHFLCFGRLPFYDD